MTYEVYQPGGLKPLKKALDPAICQKASRYAVKVFEEMSRRSQLLAEDVSVPTFDREDVMPHIGELLGRGGFNSVYSLRKNNFTDDKETKLAVKFLSDEALFIEDEFCNGAADLLMEAKYLAALAAHPHPALIQLHGISSEGPDGFSNPDRAGFFLILDRLYDTLDRRMDVWNELRRRKSGQTSALKALFLQRLLVAQDIASAVRHLHKLNVVFRDLKPDNVGFDYEGRVKLFDFGLAKELDPKQKNGDGLYNMSGGTGSRRFMAPEVALSEPYTLSADIYSFAILLWELMCLKKAFAYMPLEEHRENVIMNGERPELDPSWSIGLKEILESSWKRSPMQRPAARTVYNALRNEIQAVYSGDFGSKSQELQYEKRSTASVA
jgi:serine/threonine protein kinase